MSDEHQRDKEVPVLRGVACRRGETTSPVVLKGLPEHPYRVKTSDPFVGELGSLAGLPLLIDPVAESIPAGVDELPRHAKMSAFAREAGGSFIPALPCVGMWSPGHSEVVQSDGL